MIMDEKVPEAPIPQSDSEASDAVGNDQEQLSISAQENNRNVMHYCDFDVM